MSYVNYLIEIGPVKTTAIELIAVFFGLLSVWSMKKESILAFPFGIINVSIYVYICFAQKLYALAGINAFFAVMSIYGWINWGLKRGEEGALKITRLSPASLMLNGGAVIVFFVVLRILLAKFTDSIVPTWDAITTALYIIGMWLLARKKIENWIAWILGDSISVFLFAYEKLYFSSLQFFVFTVIAVLGFIEWRKKLKPLNP
ncbi:MAG TPA: nicotinamide riboside transporter PnuC [Bacteroidales bacterium]|nr:nicotinamide riboside transporter PnuC [Bacteroidales bacterium]